MTLIGQFASAVKREPAERKTKEVQRLPGPGSYNMPTSMDKVTRMHELARRMRSMEHGKHEELACHYFLFLRWSLFLAANSWNWGVALSQVQPPPPERQQFFGSTTKRSFEVMPQSSAAPFALKTPGPGSYDYHEGFAKGAAARPPTPLGLG